MIETQDFYDEENNHKWESFMEGLYLFPICFAIGLIIGAWLPGSMIQEPKTLVLVSFMFILAIIIDKHPKEI